MTYAEHLPCYCDGCGDYVHRFDWHELCERCVETKLLASLDELASWLQSIDWAFRS
jgi:hypothetical protein